ncbi:hypothetical protein Avbf_02308 [Armadillidium vulgare]|nr:hypothetical protein Avbf_02308 [Armadillidium vulgare]
MKLSQSKFNETCDEEAVFQNISVSPVSVPTDIDLPSTSFCETQRDKIENSIEEPVAEKNENLLMSSNRNVQGIGYSQLQNKLLETYPKMLKEPHNLLRKHRSKGPLSVLTTTISDRRRKRREMLRRSNYNFDLNRFLNDWKISDLYIFKRNLSLRRDLAINEDEDNHLIPAPSTSLVQEVELILKKNISDMCECLKTLCRKLKKKVSMNHLMDLVQYLGPDSDCLFIK